LLLGLGQPPLVWVWKFSTKNTIFFNLIFSPSDQKNYLLIGSKAGCPLIYSGLKSMPGSGEGQSLHGSLHYFSQISNYLSDFDRKKYHRLRSLNFIQLNFGFFTAVLKYPTLSGIEIYGILQ